MPSKKGCTYSRNKSGKCRSMEAHFAHTHPKKKKGTCKYGRDSKSKKCKSKKQFGAEMKRASKKMSQKRALSMLRKAVKARRASK